MAFTEDDLTALDRAIAAGELSIGLGDMRITYRSIEELLAARATVSAALASASTTPRVYPRHQLADFSDD